MPTEVFSLRLWRSSGFSRPSALELLLFAPISLFARAIYKLLNLLHSSPRKPTHPIRVVCISDTHTIIPSDIPYGDILIHAGDLTIHGTLSELQAHIDWLHSLPHPHKIAIAGNHDTYLDARSRRTLKPSDCDGELNWGTIHYLQHEEITLHFPGHGKRSLRIYGAPQIPACGGPEFAFQYRRGQDAWSGTVPAGVDVLVTHTPAKGHLDNLRPGLGCEWLLKEMWRTRPRLHVCAHVHDGWGREVVSWDGGQSVYEDLICRDERRGVVAAWIDVEGWVGLVRLLVEGGRGLVWDRVWGGGRKTTVMVNAALTIANKKKLRKEVQVVDI
ncbi:phosphoric ester hydrolase-like protein [Eremomyces bilateralis CBS 781.70]|uniref:Phosphoric ester hydrolase-like protein n=1 Tax=Eremomyces bilateralis CBS 781.70 TaxID=1392243 RepID=A0A6G1G4B3_9PEZI|nr:phosphoric ester hydrolase-like protein [Eremomyces bilateralis CBS 781.70]KAF1812781.1 phosphoric ester hydrolase-like protein [Eremomyces bilateralis CBS 781.70]